MVPAFFVTESLGLRTAGEAVHCEVGGRIRVRVTSERIYERVVAPDRWMSFCLPWLYRGAESVTGIGLRLGQQLWCVTDRGLAKAAHRAAHDRNLKVRIEATALRLSTFTVRRAQDRHPN